MEIADPVGDDLDRFFRHLVLTLAQEAPERLDQPFQVAELYQSLVPYRQHRNALGFHSHQDYEMAILRLLAGEKGYATVEPAEVQQALAQEAEAINPDTGAFREYAAARVRLNRSAVGSVLNATAAYSPLSVPAVRPDFYSPTVPAESVEPEGPPAASRAAEQRPRPAESAECPYCAAPLPSHRKAVYCPFCGVNLRSPECRRCGAELESGWRYCVECGSKIAGYRGEE
ncbi:hypothetical protein HRbin33_00682 [bacterium HR33]|nr:hypothetical protein HRbin33_00682 [bacterium HR33]